MTKPNARQERDLLYARIKAFPPGLGLEKETCLNTASTTVNQCPATSEDIALFASIGANEEEHLYIRGLALFNWRQLRVNKRPDFVESPENLKKALDMFKAAEAAAVNSTEQAWSFHTCCDHFYQVPIMERIRECIQTIEDVLYPKKEDQLYLTGLRSSVTLSPKVHSKLYIYCFNRCMVAANCCMCAKVASPTLKLKKCEQCESFYYCSRECQKFHWNVQRHKSFCRPLSVLEKGDIVRVKNLSTRGDLNGTFLELDTFSESRGRWAATWFGGGNGVWIKPENLRRAMTRSEVTTVLVTAEFTP
ncbi:hypothetical protein BCR33DRAFT_723234 [Rhizoclosmatium globosum]|uniref:MYND-type domain-containing protein n=1 Tax=Rhizoclosmatium globosum TaxID=329046 RepID=A0A1Y2BEX7_9FUNG|nr:hypothetical protein BCR33DRAFT_723234 [Rhizoclosmatium globosum]|eukprot:ORY33256.1 hypothetical protein BCR33DRAFT_723234 [Rhizoclosmatium globosum]